jgi:hypothetical protein
MMLRALTLAAVLLAPGLGHANETCNELWFTRNLIIDRTGYCFGSNLGKALFDNQGCSSSPRALTSVEAQKVGEIRESEAQIGCRVDTSRRALDVPRAAKLRALVDLPAKDFLASGCIGYRGNPIPLYAGHQTGAAVIGAVQPGNDILFEHFSVGPWAYITAHNQAGGDRFGPEVAHGWTQAGFGQNACEQWAG